jgi:hypothetical protein
MTLALDPDGPVAVPTVPHGPPLPSPGDGCAINYAAIAGEAANSIEFSYLVQDGFRGLGAHHLSVQRHRQLTCNVTCHSWWLLEANIRRKPQFELRCKFE